MQVRPRSTRIERMSEFLEIQLTLSGSYSAYARLWSAVEPHGAILYHHGIQSHCGWYEASARALCQAGYSVLQFDRRGSGRNSRDRGHAESAEQLIDDAHRARDELARLSGFANQHVIGVSWGGKLAVAAYVHNPTGVKSLTLVTPGLFPKVGVSKAEMARIGFAMLYEPKRLFDIPLNDSGLFTANPDWQRFIETDPLTLRQCTAGFYLASRRMDRIVNRLAGSPPLPIHLLLAEDERIVNNERTATFVNGLGWDQSRIAWYSGARHSLEFESDPQIYFSNLIQFISQVDALR